MGTLLSAEHRSVQLTDSAGLSEQAPLYSGSAHFARGRPDALPGKASAWLFCSYLARLGFSADKDVAHGWK